MPGSQDRLQVGARVKRIGFNVKSRLHDFVLCAFVVTRLTPITLRLLHGRIELANVELVGFYVGIVRLRGEVRDLQLRGCLVAAEY